MLIVQSASMYSGAHLHLANTEINSQTSALLLKAAAVGRSEMLRQ